MRHSSPEPEQSGESHRGWRLLAWPDFAHHLASLQAHVDRLRERDPDGYRAHPQAKLLTNVLHLIFDVIPADPNAPAFQQGNTLGPQYRHWRRAKFSGRFRLFFRFHSATRTIVYAWLNDENTLRKAGAKTDPYTVFRRMLESGSPPSDYERMLKESVPLKMPEDQ
jgi:toxin YhaV